MRKYQIVLVIFLIFLFMLLAWKARDVDFHKNLKPAISVDQH